MGILIGVFIVAIFTDMKYYKIPNLVILFGMATGIAYSIYRYSYAAMIESLLCMAVVFLAFYPFYILGGLGAGDVKLFMMTSCFFRNDSLLNFLLVTMIIGAVIAIVKMIAFKESRKRIVYLGGYIRKVALTGAIDNYEIDKGEKRALIRMAVPAFISLMLMCAGIYA